MNKDAIWVYWTGGYDSTFVVLNFLIAKKGGLTGARIQPVYLQKCDARLNSDIEQQTMQEIRKTILQRYPESTKYLLPTISVDCSAVELDADIQNGMWELYRTKRLRHPKSQYSYIAQAPRLLGHVIDSGAELGPGTCISQYVRPYINYFLKKVLLLTKVDQKRPSIDGLPWSASVSGVGQSAPRKRFWPAFLKSGNQFMLDPKQTPWYIWIFSGVRFPVVLVTKQQMWAIAKKKGFEDLLRRSWTCRVPKRVGNTIVSCNKCALCKERIVPALVKELALL